MESLVLKEYEQFDVKRRTFEARQADRQDETELKKLADKIKNRGAI